MWQRSSSLVLAAILLGLAGNGQPARAQDDADADEEPPPPRHALFPSDEQFELWFDRWAFGAIAGAGQNRIVDGQGRRIVVRAESATAATAREHLESQLDAKLRELDRSYMLTAGQKKKLGLAGKRDIQRFFDAADDLKKLLKEARDDRVAFLAILNDRNRNFMNRRLGGDSLFGQGSLLAKTLNATVTNPPSDTDAQETYRLCVERVVSLHDQRLGLREVQHRRFVTLIVAETPPLKHYGEYNAFAVMFQVSRLPESKLAAILSKRQIGVLHDRFLEAQTYEKVLIANGYLDGAGSEGSPTGAGDGAKRKKVEVRPLPRRAFTGQD